MWRIEGSHIYRGALVMFNEKQEYIFLYCHGPIHHLSHTMQSHANDKYMYVMLGSGHTYMNICFSHLFILHIFPFNT